MHKAGLTGTIIRLTKADQNMRRESPVYFFRSNEIGKLIKILPKFRNRLGIKVHFGEEGNRTFIPAKVIKKITDSIKNPVLVECSVLYKSKRRTASGHREVALAHGFNFAKLDFLDGECGDDSAVVKINKKHFEYCYLGAGIKKYKSLLVISHFKGHRESNFSGALKNIGMGLASRRGKLAQHSSIRHYINESICTGCGQCRENCPVKAISIGRNRKAKIKEKICISCSKCIAVCPTGAIKVPWGSTGPKKFQERIAEYALAVVSGRKGFYVNFLKNITRECDCYGKAMKKLTKDIGILASHDPVAIDQASYDLVVKQYPEFSMFDSEFLLKHAQDIGAGRRKYKIIKN